MRPADEGGSCRPPLSRETVTPPGTVEPGIIEGLMVDQKNQDYACQSTGVVIVTGDLRISSFS